MIAKILMKNPVLMIGIIFMGLFLNQLRLKGYFTRDGLIPTSCKSSLVMLNKRIKKNWSTRCNHNEMLITIDMDSEKLRAIKDIKKYKAFIYRELANHLIFVAKNSPEDSMSRVDKIFIFENSKRFNIQALTEGKYLVKFITLKDSSYIMKHLQNTVKVKEISK